MKDGKFIINNPTKMKEKEEKAEQNNSIPDVIESENKLQEMAKLHKPKIESGKSDFYLAWRLCYEWISGMNK